MFDAVIAVKFWNAIQHLGQQHKLYVFDELSNDVISLYNRKYEIVSHTGLNDLSNIEIEVGMTGILRQLHEYVILQTLNDVLKFKIILVGHESRNLLTTSIIQSRKNIIMESSLVNAPQECALLPVIKFYKLLWLNNLEYVKSSLYFTETFTVQLWSTFFIFFIGVVLVSWMCQSLANKLHYVYFDLVSLILNQGSNICYVNYGFATKIVLILLGFLLVMFYSAFGAFIDSLLAIKKIDAPFRDIFDLYRMPDFAICSTVRSSPVNTIKRLKMVDGSNVVQLNSKDCPSSSLVYSQWDTNLDYKCDLKKIVFLHGLHSSVVKKILPLCNLSPMATKYFNNYNGITVSKSFQYREEFNFVLLQMYSSGVSGYISENLFDKFNNRTKQQTIEGKIVNFEEPITVQQIYIIFILLILGALLALIVLLLEIVWVKKN